MLTEIQRYQLRRWRRRVWLGLVQHPLEALFALGVEAWVTLLPHGLATAAGGKLARLIGPRIGRSRIAHRNLERALPELDAAGRARVVAEMWEHMGRGMFEYAALHRLDPRHSPRVTVEGLAHLEALAQDGAPGLVFSGHLGQWELVTLSARMAGLQDLHLVYRPANNALLNRQIRRLQRESKVTLVQKGAGGARDLLGALKQGGHVIMLVDQRMNDGIPVPFFGQDAMTAPALAQLALRFQAPVVPVQSIRLRDDRGRLTDRFRVIVHTPLRLPDSGDRHADVAALMADVNRLLERWIRAHPEQWLWMHRRWPQ